MSRVRVFVEDQEIDAGDEISAQLTYAIDDIRDFSSRNTSFSKTIVLPGSDTNKKVFGHVFNLGSGNFNNPSNQNIGYNYNASKSAKCRILMNEIQVFKGVLRILKVIFYGNQFEVEVAVSGELGGVVYAIEGKKLEDLDFSSYDHTFNYTNISNSWSASPGSGYYYPLIDFGYSVDKVSFPIETLRSAFYAKQYIDKIITAAGYTYESTFFNTSYFKKLIIPFSGQFPTIEVTDVLHLTDASYLVPGSPNPASPMAFDTQVGSSYILVDGTKRFFVWNRSDAVSEKFTFACNWSRTGTTGADILSVYIYKNASVVYTFDYDMLAATSGSLSFETTLELDTNDSFVVCVAFPNGSLQTATITSTVFKITGQPTTQIPIKYGDSVIANNMIPRNVQQKDFLVWLLKMFNLYIYEDKDRDKHLKIEPYIDFYDITSRLNWDEKLDRSQAVVVTPLGELNSRIYEFKYKDDSDYYNDLYKKKYGVAYGSFIHDTGFEGAHDTKSLEIGFSPTPLVQYSNSDRVLPVIIKKSGLTEERTTANIRILFRAAANISCQTWYLKDDTTTVATLTDYPYCGHLDDPDAPANDLCFGSPFEFYFTIVAGYLSANLFNVFWSFYISEISDKDSKVLEAYFKINPVDIYNLDFSKIIYLSGLLWRLNKIIDYTTDQPSLTKCELLKVTDLE